ncbi:hypothetical protein USDA257_c14120 [Sinorhizobium fredii USDA 257]|uniref:Uncharacterized protein n=1 Tax=Sinorhizobium fredii (strain USDA 257) TaxID=1185652 RepID=I3X296_SINF2|nr:hypothetical protein USDA257_c14120 [Sinorhizobium fredii USDA 257]
MGRPGNPCRAVFVLPQGMAIPHARLCLPLHRSRRKVPASPSPAGSAGVMPKSSWVHAREMLLLHFLPEKRHSFGRRPRRAGNASRRNGCQQQRGGTLLNASPNDLALIAVMRRYFLLKDEANALKQRMEAARKDAGEGIDRFYDPRLNAAHADDILAWHRLRKEQEELMNLAARWGRGGSIEDYPVETERPAETVHMLGIHAVTD